MNIKEMRRMAEEAVEARGVGAADVWSRFHQMFTPEVVLELINAIDKKPLPKQPRLEIKEPAERKEFDPGDRRAPSSRGIVKAWGNDDSL